MRLDETESLMRGLPVPRAPEEVRARVMRSAKEHLLGAGAGSVSLHRPSRGSGTLAFVAAVAACGISVTVALLGPERPKGELVAEAESCEELAARVRDPRAPGRARAVRALSDAAGRKAMPAVASVLGDPDPEVRVAAADALCRNGAHELGVPVLLREARELTALNAGRQPGAWRLLADAPSPPSGSAAARDRVRELARAAGFEVDWTGAHALDDRGWAASLPPDASATVLPALESALRLPDGGPGPYEMILEPDRIRLVPRDEALRFWRAWWGER